MHPAFKARKPQTIKVKNHETYFVSLQKITVGCQLTVKSHNSENQGTFNLVLLKHKKTQNYHVLLIRYFFYLPTY